MKKFLVLYKSQTSAMEQMSNATPEQAKAGMEAWMAWSKAAGHSIVELGAPTGNAMKVESGKSGPGDGTTSGFSILQAESSKALLGVLDKHPHLMVPGNSLEVLEFLPMPGM